MNQEEKTDKILEIVQKLEVDSAVVKEQVNRHSSYFKWLAGSGGIVSLAGFLVAILIKVF